MLISKRVRNMEPVIEAVAGKHSVYVALADVVANAKRLVELGFSTPLTIGEALLPAAQFGRAARRNANGYEIVHRNQPKEVRYHQIQWTWTERHGSDSVEKTGIKERPYYRYPRTAIPPFAVELHVRDGKDGALVIAAGPFDPAKESEVVALQNTIHMFIDLFGSCAVVSDLEAAKAIAVRRLNWEILPRGKRPWEDAEPILRRLVQQAKPNEQPVLQARFDAIGKYQPTFTATGRGGFSRYVVHGWETQQVYLLESLTVNNATYVLKDNWEAVSKLTKAEILSADAHKARLIHREHWFSDLDEFMKDSQIGRADEG